MELSELDMNTTQGDMILYYLISQEFIPSFSNKFEIALPFFLLYLSVNTKGNKDIRHGQHHVDATKCISN